MGRFGEVIDINMPRDQETGKPKGFSFLMYEDQRSTVLAVDNLNGAQVLGRTIRVDHCKKYEQRGTKNAEGDYVAPEEPTYNAMPPTLEGEPFYFSQSTKTIADPTSGSSDEDSSDSDAEALDEEDPMAAYLRQQKKTQKITDGKKRKRDGGESKEERKARKEEKRRRKDERDRKRREREARKGGARQADAGPSRLSNGRAPSRSPRSDDSRKNGSYKAGSKHDADDRRERLASPRRRGEEDSRYRSQPRHQEERSRPQDQRRYHDEREDIRRGNNESQSSAERTRRDDRSRFDEERDHRRHDDTQNDRSRRDHDVDRRHPDRRWS